MSWDVERCCNTDELEYLVTKGERSHTGAIVHVLVQSLRRIEMLWDGNTRAIVFARFLELLEGMHDNSKLQITVTVFGIQNHAVEQILLSLIHAVGEAVDVAKGFVVLCAVRRITHHCYLAG